MAGLSQLETTGEGEAARATWLTLSPSTEQSLTRCSASRPHQPHRPHRIKNKANTLLITSTPVQIPQSDSSPAPHDASHRSVSQLASHCPAYSRFPATGQPSVQPVQSQVQGTAIQIWCSARYSHRPDLHFPHRPSPPRRPPAHSLYSNVPRLFEVRTLCAVTCPDVGLPVTASHGRVNVFQELPHTGKCTAHPTFTVDLGGTCSRPASFPGPSSSKVSLLFSSPH